ncbi:MAG: hypothetical protein KAW12_12000 [Candidatus Aminicenantes bacterium]|nr:hypothetical protein [Candidatus Aminicenantes bacterium]
MKQLLKVFLVLHLLIGITWLFSPVDCSLSWEISLSAAPQQDSPGIPDIFADEEDSKSFFMNGVIFIASLALLWFLFYKLLYPFLLKYYQPSYCKKLFWSLLMLYGLGWITIGSYILFEFGFRIDLLKWVFVFIGIIWIIWFLLIMLKKDEAYY